jgi:hypothetical protein
MPQSPLTGSFLHAVQPVHSAVEAGAEERGVPRHGGGRGEASLHHQERSQAPRPQCKLTFLKVCRAMLWNRNYFVRSDSCSDF